jgi:peptidoglycan/LPS O-acetylase OafA/YrhL
MKHREGLGTLGLGTIEYFLQYLVCYFSFGMFAAFLKKNFKLERIANSVPATCLGIVLTGILLFFMAPRSGFPEGAALALPFLMIVFGNSFFGLLRIRPLILLGQISYSTYVLHGIILFTANHLLARTINMATISPLSFWLFTAVTGTIVVCVSALSYRFFEAPFMKGYGVKRAKTVPLAT